MPNDIRQFGNCSLLVREQGIAWTNAYYFQLANIFQWNIIKSPRVTGGLVVFGPFPPPPLSPPVTGRLHEMDL